MASQSMSGPPQGSSGGSRLGKKAERPRRSWTQAEKEVLIASVKELITQGWKSDNGFRAGYLGRLEETMKKHFPGTDLKQNSYINSKLSGWKKSYYALCVIMGKSGVGFNTGTFMIECEDSAWEQVVKVIIYDISKIVQVMCQCFSFELSCAGSFCFCRMDLADV